MATVDKQLVLNKLKEAKALIATEKTWCQGVPRRYDRFYALDQYCAISAAYIVSGDDDVLGEMKDVLAASAFKLFKDSIIQVNDMRGFEQVHQVYDDAIQTLEKELHT